jgi:cyclic pyranopterin phosphate synthase
MSQSNLIDGFGREVGYLRLSLTDRCDLRCIYCMSEKPEFMPKSTLLSAVELAGLLKKFAQRGIKKIRLTGGEPLARRDFLSIAESVAKLELDEWTITSNGTRLPLYAKQLYDLGLRRINISLDSLRADVFAKITRGGILAKTLAGIDAAQENNIKVKINCVALAGINEEEIASMIEWAHNKKIDFTLIETMPMSDTGLDLTKHYLPLIQVRAMLEQKWQLELETKKKLSGPAQLYKIVETGGRLGLITPLSNKFCSACNRVRVSADGKLWTCLGQNHFIDLKQVIRTGGDLDLALDKAMKDKPLEHNFFIGTDKIAGSPARMMAATGG